MTPSPSSPPKGLSTVHLVAAHHHHVSSLCARLVRLLQSAGNDRQKVGIPRSAAGCGQGQRVGNGSHSTDSVGLGLSVSRRLARLMGGDLTYDYVDGWSEFRLSLPITGTD